MANPHTKPAPYIYTLSQPGEDKLPPRPLRSRLVVFGGSFNPVHNGHLFMAGEILRRGLAEEVLFVPAGVRPHKEQETMAPAEHRLAMLKLALDDWHGFSQTDIEIRQPDAPSYTIHTMETLQLAYSESTVTFLMGQDCLAELHSWHRANELVAGFPFLIYPRAGTPLPKMPDLADTFGPKSAMKLLACVIENAPSLPASATAVREAVARGASLAGLVPPAVARYIQENGLYRAGA